jgi:hypothetical protein
MSYCINRTVSIGSDPFTTFTLSLALKDVEIGAGAVDDERMQENLAKIFGIEGSSSLSETGFSSDNVHYTIGASRNGMATVDVRPKDAGAGSFFIRARLTP